MAALSLPPDAALPSTLVGTSEEPVSVGLTWFTAPAHWTTQGEWSKLDWEELLQRVSAPELWPGGGGIAHARDRLPGWSFARYRNDSRVPAPGEPPEETAIERIREVWGVIVEYVDDATVGRKEIERRWGAWRYVAYTTAFHDSELEDQPAGPRWRVMLPLAEPVSAEVAQQLGAWARHPRRRAGIVSSLTDDPTRWVAVPALAPGGYEWSQGRGEYLDPQRCLAELKTWHEADRQDRARVVLAGTSVGELASRVAARAEGQLPWPAGFDPGTPLQAGEVVAVVSEIAGLRRSFGLLLARTVGETGRPVLHVSTTARIEETLGRLLSLANPHLTWQQLAEDVQGGARLAPLAQELSQRAPELHLVAPGPSERGLERLAEEWRALLEATERSGLLVLDDPVDLGPGEGTFRRAVGLPLRDLAATRSEQGAGAAVVVVTSPTSARSLPVDLVIRVERDRIIVVDSDGCARKLELALNPRTGELAAGAQPAGAAAPTLF